MQEATMREDYHAGGLSCRRTTMQEDYHAGGLPRGRHAVGSKRWRIIIFELGEHPGALAAAIKIGTKMFRLRWGLGS
ncbi:uncharacterized protein N7506_005643 [Penicillium brevicompactum]|uniref:uncharacterized protein n=1 Tax=Penicillium brevicompactum TaxID=5074 RepID=UPI002540EDAB|nr:uncharacterized protein N7506_005643 [Penicillium brevicompactum]KAJ5335707.1 hypothetical protein N7506_005643 [Penicillium brevicompactum]